MFGDINTSIYINPIAEARSQNELNRTINELETERIVAADRGNINRESNLTQKRFEAENLRDEIAAGYNKLYEASVISTLFAYSLEDLDRLTKMLSAEMSKSLVGVKSAWAMQEEAFQSNLPFAQNKINKTHTFDRRSMATVFPFTTSEVGHTTGIPLGFNKQTGVPILIDKDEITGRDKTVLNVENKVEDVTQALLTMARGSTRSQEVNEVTKQIIAESVAQEYAAYGITNNPASIYESRTSNSGELLGRMRKKMPTIGSWYKRLQRNAEMNQNQDYRFHYSYLLKVMKQYIREYDGQMAYFDGQSTFDLLDGTLFINLDISQLEERFARPLAQQILLSWIWEKYVKKNSEDRKKAAKKRVLVDEAWMLLPYPEAVDFLNTMARRARKRNVSLAIISQRFQDFYEKPEVQAVLTSSDTKLLLAQDKSEIQYVKEVFKLSEGEAGFLTTCNRGEGLLKVGSDTAILQITPTAKEYEFVETNLNKLMENNQNRA